jgi:ketosteroid isomerase-like protein
VSSTSDEGSGTGDPEDVVRRFQDAIGRGSWDDATLVLDPLVVFHEAPTLPFGGDHRGVDGYRALAEAFGALADFEFDPTMELMTTTTGTVIVRGSFTVTGKATGRTASTRFAEFYVLTEGRIVDVDVFYWDEAAVIRALVD